MLPSGYCIADAVHHAPVGSPRIVPVSPSLLPAPALKCSWLTSWASCTAPAAPWCAAATEPASSSSRRGQGAGGGLQVEERGLSVGERGLSVGEQGGHGPRRAVRVGCAQDYQVPLDAAACPVEVVAPRPRCRACSTGRRRRRRRQRQLAGRLESHRHPTARLALRTSRAGSCISLHGGRCGFATVLFFPVLNCFQSAVTESLPPLVCCGWRWRLTAGQMQQHFHGAAGMVRQRAGLVSPQP